MATMTKPNPVATVKTNDLILDIDGLVLDGKAKKVTQAYFDGVLEWEANWDQLNRDRQELLADALDMVLRDIFTQADDLKERRERLQAELRQLLEERFALLPMLQVPYEKLVSDTKAELEAAYASVGDRFQKDGCGIEADLGYRYNPASAKIRFRARCGQQPECLRVQAKLNELSCRHSGYLTQRKVNEQSRTDTASRVTRWPAVDGQQQKIARFLEVS